MTARTFAVSRAAGPTLQARVKAAVTAYYLACRCLPAGIVVHPAEVEAARAAVAALELRLPVRGTGGCLVPEVWLEVSGAAP